MQVLTAGAYNVLAPGPIQIRNPACFFLRAVVRHNDFSSDFDAAALLEQGTDAASDVVLLIPGRYDHRNQGWFTWQCNDFTFSRTEDSVLY